MSFERGIRFQGVGKRYGSKQVLSSIYFEARPGEITALLGKNGAGKTTALRILVQLESASDGVVVIDGYQFSELAIGSVGVSLNLGFPPTRRVVRQLEVAALATGASRERLLDVARETGVDQFLALRCGKLSMGMKQRLNLACAFMGDPHTLILDEPVNGLDPDGIRWLHTFLRHEAARGKTILVTSHFLHDLEQYVDQVLIIDREVLWSGRWPDASGRSLAEVYEEATVGRE
jgi:ABC-2 type transport system ATP-binding protein